VPTCTGFLFVAGIPNDCQVMAWQQISALDDVESQAGE
jgi:hypothetical protein